MTDDEIQELIKAPCVFIYGGKGSSIAKWDTGEIIDFPTEKEARFYRHSRQIIRQLIRQRDEARLKVAKASFEEFKKYLVVKDEGGNLHPFDFNETQKRIMGK